MPTSIVTISLNSSLSWGKVTEAQVRSAIGDPAELPASTRQEFKALLARNADGFEPAARAALEGALTVPERTFDPTIPRRDGTAEYTRVPGGRLVVDGMAPSDVAQGVLGDCYLLATLAGFAHARPEVLRDAITDNGNGTYTVRFFEDDPVYGVHPVLITVDDDLPTRDGVTIYAATPAGELWPALIEKAYAKFKGSYGLIGRGNLPGQVAFDLTGDVPSMRLVGFTSERRTFERMRDALAGSQPVMAATITGGLEGMVGGHVYTVTRAFEQDGTKWVEVRNPWGVQPPVATPRGIIHSVGGSVTLTLEEFSTAFPATFIAD